MNFFFSQCLGATLGTSGLKIHTHNKQIDMQSDAAATASVIIEYLPCGTLKSYLRKNRKRKLAFKTVVRMALDLARGSDKFLSHIYPYFHSMFQLTFNNISVSISLGTTFLTTIDMTYYDWCIKKYIYINK